MSLTVLEPGLYTLPVAAPRPGSRHLGVPVGGPADAAALAVANALVGNAHYDAALEITLTGPTVRAEVPVAVAVFGAPFALAVGNRGREAAGCVVTLNAGDVLKIGGTPSGARAYLTVAGGFGFPEVLGSRGGFDPVEAGQVLPCGPSKLPPRGLAFAALVSAEPDVLRVVPGPQHEWFYSPLEFTANAYEVTATGNRMGLRLKGPVLERRPGELQSEPVAPGAVQVTNDGMPVVLGVDGQTIGGYPKIAHVIRADLDKLGQLRPGSPVRFRFVTPAESQAAWHERERIVNEWLIRLQVSGGQR